MPVQSVQNSMVIHGLQELPVKRRHYVGFVEDEPLTEEQKEQNRKPEPNFSQIREYNRHQREICCVLDDKIFVAQSLSYVTSMVTGTKIQISSPEIEPTKAIEGLTMSENINILKIRKRDASLGYKYDMQTLRTLSRSLRDRTPSSYPEPDTPELFYRAFKDGCHGRHSKDLGFRSSDQPLSHPVYHDGTLLNSMVVDEEVLSNHCEGLKPSNLIALSDSPSRMLRILRKPDREGDMIAVINVSRLLAMGVLFNRTTTFAEKFGMKLWKGHLSPGLQYANYNYWVAYRWIPAECIEYYISGSCFREACDSLGIGENDFNARLSLDEILPLQFQSLST